MKIWHQYPFFRLLVPFATGIIIALISGMPVRISFRIISLTVLGFVLIVFVKRLRVKYKSRWILGIAMNILLVILGYQLTVLKTPAFDKNNISHFISKAKLIIVKVEEPVVEKSKSMKVIATVQSFMDSLKWHKAGGKIILYFAKGNNASGIKYGDILVVNTELKTVQSPHNPGEFNYAGYLGNKGIYNQGYVRDDSWRILARNRGNPVKSMGIGIRSKFLGILKKNNVSGKEFAVASAILLGYDDYLDADQKQAFAGAGAMHILCVSGLHVGIIFVVLNFLLAFLNKKKSARIVKIILLLFFIWFYALITGFSPSVSRAATMFSFIILGLNLKRPSNIYNTIAASAFVLLVINPYLITEVGFQLSYIAVAGIVWIYKPVYTIFISGNKIVDFVWKITVVSFAATLATFPLSLYYFHQFPRLFLLTNLVVIPFTILIIYTGMLVLTSSFFPPVSGFLGLLLSALLKILSYSVEFIEGLPFAVYRGAFITTTEVILIFGLTISLVVFFMNKRKWSVYAFMISGLLLLGLFTLKKYKSLKQRSFVVYDIDKTTALQFAAGKEAVLVADTGFFEDDRKFEFYVRNNLWKSGIKRLEKLTLDKEIVSPQILKTNNFVLFNSKSLFVVDDKTELFPVNNKVKVDYLLLSHNPDVHIEELLSSIDFGKVIFDSSNSLRKLRLWRKECKEKGIDFYDVMESGALTVSF